MSQTQYKTLMSNLLKEKRALAKIRAELEGRKGRLCRCCKEFGHLARNCRNKRREEKGIVIPLNKFEVLKSRVMQCRERERMIRQIKIAEVECFECRELGHKCRECPLWVKRKNEERAAHVAKLQKAQQEKRPARPVRGKVQEGERKLRRVEGSEAARPTGGNAQREGWKRSLWETLRKRAEWYCGLTVPQDAELWELGWRSPKRQKRSKAAHG